MLHVPFVTPADFVDEDILRRVPEQHRYFEMMCTCPHGRARRTLQCHTDALYELQADNPTTKHAETMLAMMFANRDLVNDSIGQANCRRRTSPA